MGAQNLSRTYGISMASATIPLNSAPDPGNRGAVRQRESARYPAHAPSQRSGLGVQDHRLRKTYQRASRQSPYDRDQRTIPSTSSAAGMSCQRMTSRCAIPSGTCSTVTSQNLVPTDASPRLVCTGGPPRFFPISGPNRRRPRRNLPAPRPVAPKFFIATMHSTALDDRRSGLPSGSDV
jgi:hypothetical protein